MVPVDLEDVTRYLKDLGLDDLEVDIYLALLRNGPSKASSVISLTDASRGTVYRVLSDLVDRGIVRKELSKPGVYRPAEPEALFESSLDELEQRQRYVELLRGRLQGTLESIAAEPPAATNPEWAVLEGRSAIYDRLETLYGDAEQTILKLTTQDVSTSSVPIVERGWSSLMERGSEGVDVRVLSHRPDELHACLEDLGDPQGIQIRDLEVEELLHFAVVDGAETVYWMDPSEVRGIHDDDDAAIHTDAPGLVAGARALFEQHWS